MLSTVLLGIALYILATKNGSVLAPNQITWQHDNNFLSYSGNLSVLVEKGPDDIFDNFMKTTFFLPSIQVAMFFMAWAIASLLGLPCSLWHGRSQVCEQEVPISSRKNNRSTTRATRYAKEELDTCGPFTNNPELSIPSDDELDSALTVEFFTEGKELIILSSDH